jgi:integrase
VVASGIGNQAKTAPPYIKGMETKISKRAVDQLTPNHPKTILWDSELKGFGVRCRPSGARFYILKTRIGGQQRWLTIGRHGSPWTPETARREALRLLGLKATGLDPATQRDRQKGAITVAELGVKFLDEYVAQYCKPTTAELYRYAVELHINPVLGRQHVVDVTRPDVARLHHQLRDRPYQANRVLAVISKMMNLAEAWGLRPDGTNPVRHIKKNREAKRERYLTDEELQRLGTVLVDGHASQAESPFALAAIWLLILTGARLTEVLTLKWAYVDIENSVLHLPDSKTGAKPVYLNVAAISLLQSIPRMEGNPYVIAGKIAGARLINLQKPWRRLRKQAGLEDVRIHDLRHSFASVAVGSGMSLPMIGKLLGHTQPATTARYTHLAADPMRAASGLVGAKIDSLMRGGESSRRRLRLVE